MKFEIAFLVLLLFSPSIAAQLGLVHTDAVGDVEFTIAPVNDPGIFSWADWTSLEIQEPDAETLRIIADRTTPPIEASTAATKKTAEIRFTIGSNEYAILPYQNCAPNGDLVHVTEEGFFHLACAPITIEDRAGNTRWIFDATKSSFNIEGQPPIRTGDIVTNLHATAWWYLGEDRDQIFAHDTIPDAGPNGESYSIQFGDESSGDLSLSSPQSTRITNGADQTLAFQLNISNSGTVAHKVVLSSTNVPATWTVRFPGIVEIQPKQEASVTVWVSIPSGHQHGHFETFKVTVTDQTDSGSHASYPLAVHWTDIPQPAGHHNTLFLHSAPARGFSDQLVVAHSVWMNAAKSDPSGSATDEPAMPTSSEATTGPSGSTVEWVIPLDPKLAIGIDSRIEEPAKLKAHVTFPSPVTRAEIEGILHYCANDCSMELASGMGEASIVGQDAYFELDLKMSDAAEFIEFNPMAQLKLSLNVNSAEPTDFLVLGERPMLVPEGFSLELPLNEYLDPQDDLVASSLPIKIDVRNEVLAVNPGRGTLFEITLTNEGDKRLNLGLDLFGPYESWATLGASIIPLSPGESRETYVHVAAPKDSFDGQQALLFIIAHDVNDESRSSFARILADVVGPETRDIPDIPKPAQEPKNTPVPIILPLVGLGLAFRRNRA